MHDSGAAFQDGYHEALRDVREGKEDARRAVDWPAAPPLECRYAGGNRGWCIAHDAEWRIDRTVCDGATPDRADPCPACNGEPMSPDCAICGGSGLATPDRAGDPYNTIDPIDGGRNDR